MAQQHQMTDDLVVGRGRIYFNHMKDGKLQGERYLGNTPNFSMTSNVDKLEHFSSEAGFREKDKSINLANNRSGSLSTDIISVENVAMWFGGAPDVTLASSQNDVVEIFPSVSRNRNYQLGMSGDHPQGLGGVDPSKFQIAYADGSVSISDGSGDLSTMPGVTQLARNNWRLDATRGRVYIEMDAPDIKGDMQLIVKYDRKASAQTVVINHDAVLEGALRFESNNPTGAQKNYYFPKVSLSPNGDYALKGDSWQELSFSFDVLRLNDQTAQVHMYTTPVTAQDTSRTLTLTAGTPSIRKGTGTSEITIKVVDGSGAPAIGTAVKLSASEGTLNFDRATIDTMGQAKATYTAPANAGTYRVTGVIEGSGQAKTVDITVTD